MQGVERITSELSALDSSAATAKPAWEESTHELRPHELRQLLEHEVERLLEASEPPIDPGRIALEALERWQHLQDVGARLELLWHYLERFARERLRAE
jgi:hypothetical protein